MIGIGSVAPTGNVGIGLSNPQLGTARPSAYIITAVVTVAPSDLIMWGCVVEGVSGDRSDDIWGMFSDKRGNNKQGKIGTALAIGTHHILVEDAGIFAAVFFTKSAGTVDISGIRPVFYANRGS